jgi:uncharacterized protein (DUF2336 family)
MIATRRSLIGELDSAVRNGSKRERVETLRRITDLFLASSARLSEEQISVFDDVIGHLMKRVEDRNLAELSQRLAPIENAPNSVIHSLARNNEIAVAGPVLTFSARLTSADLIEISKSKPQGHLQAIACRTDLGPSVTDVLLDRGNFQVHESLAGNQTARFSDEGMCQLIKYAERNESLSGKLGLRLDIPLHLLRSLLENASETVRKDILAVAPAAQRAEVANLLETMGFKVRDDGPDAGGARAHVMKMFEDGELDEISLLEFARSQQHVHMTMALSVMCSVDYREMEQILNGMKIEDLLIPCRAAGVSWNTFRAIMESSPAGGALGEHRMLELKKDYSRLAVSTAERVLRLRSRQLSAVEPG